MRSRLVLTPLFGLALLAPVARAADVPLYEVGSLSRAITTASPEAQQYFDQGLVLPVRLQPRRGDPLVPAGGRARSRTARWRSGASRSRTARTSTTPMLPPERAKAACEALAKGARRWPTSASPVERALIEALAARYADPPPEDRKPLDEAYADAMRHGLGSLSEGRRRRRAVRRGPDGPAAVGPVDRPTAQPQPGTEEIVAALEAVLHARPAASAARTTSTSTRSRPRRTRSRADAAADPLRDLLPALGHLVHMPSHIDVRARALAARRSTPTPRRSPPTARYRRASPRAGLLPRLHGPQPPHARLRRHDVRARASWRSRRIREMVAGHPAELVPSRTPLADGFIADAAGGAGPLRPLGRRSWPRPSRPTILPISRALRHYARGVAFAAKGDIARSASRSTSIPRGRAEGREGRDLRQQQRAPICSTSPSAC